MNSKERNMKEKLIALAGCITQADKNAVIEKGLCSMPTLNNYLRGEIVKLELAEKLIIFLEERLEANQEKVREVLAS